MDTNPKLLVIDDEETMLSLFEAVLADRGYVIATARSGREGVEIARSGGFDVVISDIKMPDITGIDVLAAIRELSDEIGVVLITGYASLETAVDAVRLGADAYLLKPFEDFEQDVLEPISRIAQKYGLRRENTRLSAKLNEANEHLKRANHEYRRALAQLTMQHQLASVLCGARDVPGVVAIVAQALTSGFNTHAYALLLAHSDGQFDLIGSSGLAIRPGETVCIRAGAGAVGEALATPRPTRLDIRSPDAEGREPWMPQGVAALVVPTLAAGSVVGGVVVFDPDLNHLFHADTVTLYTLLAAQIAAPLALARLAGASERGGVGAVT
jgi:CheY-like chemotaxis protein